MSFPAVGVLDEAGFVLFLSSQPRLDRATPITDAPHAEPDEYRPGSIATMPEQCRLAHAEPIANLALGKDLIVVVDHH